MTAFELIAILLLVGGIVWGVWGAAGHGIWAMLLGGLVGVAKGFLVYVVFMASILIPLSLGLRYRPPFPRCRNGKCKDPDFTYVYLDSEPTGIDKDLEQKYGGKLVRCKCGTLYLRSNRDRRFYEVREDRTLTPFLRYRMGGRWRPDENASVERR